MKSVVIIGGGFFGIYLSDFLAKIGHKVILLERESEFMTRASYVNQARVHNGYHYPRSILTALRSRASFPRFVNEFRDCIDTEFEKYYLIGNALSKVTAKQFKTFCDRIGAPCKEDKSMINGLLNPSMIEACFSTIEYAFNSHKLRDIMVDRINDSKVDYRFENEAISVVEDNGRIKVSVAHTSSLDEVVDVIHADHVFNCTYSGINLINKQSDISLIPLKHEMTEMCLVDVPNEIKKIGITVMCGPFFSMMPFPSKGLHSFSHVRYTPHYEWHDKKMGGFINSHEKYLKDKRNSAWKHMIKDASKYIPILNDCKYEESIWDIKTVLPRSEANDSRPILFIPNYVIKGYHCIMGGKIDNVYDAIESILSSHIMS
ncbi:FAD-dependent oxidoreductase [Vibrio cholerae]|uniref:FAD-dependent oxidoreductase n=1 Tax=Vibrio cholerae TaxID=666 RepID=UPI0011D58F59|nr:FAD-dependent oxidoreductase [Vibrio cholerae]TXY76819.1 FAD-binding oxidoreductase [Vibrio cholerae]BCN16759.1 putative monosaccharide biosynthesis protein [Vibrio cholerae]GHX13725.1 D amino acid oxidase [Vibrio cholerae]